MFLKILYVFCRPNGNVKCPATSLLEKGENVFNLAAISQCEGHIWDSAHVFQVKSAAGEG
jgi:hypothetical protein